MAKILIIENEEIYTDLLGGWLSAQGFEYLSVASVTDFMHAVSMGTIAIGDTPIVFLGHNLEGYGTGQDIFNLLNSPESNFRGTIIGTSTERELQKPYLESSQMATRYIGKNPYALLNYCCGVLFSDIARFENHIKSETKVEFA